MSTWLHWATLGFYLLGTGVFLCFMVFQKSKLHFFGQIVLWVGFSLHTLALATAWFNLGAFPALNMRQSLDVFAWAVMAAGLLANLRMHIMVIGAFVSPFCAILLLSAAVLPVLPNPPSPLMKSFWVASHVLTILLGYGLCTLNFLGSVLFLVQNNLIRSKNIGPIFRRLPSLSRIDNLNAKSLMAGFIFLTLGMTTGAIYGYLTLGSYWSWDPKEASTLATWMLYAVLAHTRLVQGWQGRRGALLAIVAYFVLLFTYLGTGLLFPSYHNFETMHQLEGIRQ